MRRSELINQLRHALEEATRPGDHAVEFEIAETEFCFDWFDPEVFEDTEESNE